jgi:signal transduction histidine kinase
MTSSRVFHLPASFRWSRMPSALVAVLRIVTGARSLGLLVVLWTSSAFGADTAVFIDVAERQVGSGAWQSVRLPDWPMDPPIQPVPEAIRYRVTLPPKAWAAPALLMEGVLLNGSIRFNGHLLREATDPVGRTLPRGLDRIALLSLPGDLWRVDGNTVEIQALAQGRMSISRIEIGELGALAVKHRTLVLTHFISPLVAGGIVGTLGLAMLALWARLREAPFLLFAIGALAWWLVNWMPLFAWPPVGGVAYAIAWISLFGVVVAAFAAFCLRLAGWYRPRLEAALVALAASGPVLLAASYAIDQMDIASSVWRLMLVAGVGVALVSVCRAYWQTRSRSSLAMAFCGAIALVLGALDWVGDLDETTNHPISLTTYAGLAFAAAAAALLVERYVAAAKASAQWQARLEERVQAQGEQLRSALKDMEAARDAARAADQAKSSFLAVASHDLRQPAHAVGLYLEAMPRSGLSTEQAEILGRLQDSHAALERMFDALLDMSQIDAGTLVPKRRSFQPWTLLQRLADEAAPAAEAKGLRLALRAGQGADRVEVYTDAVLLERLLRNLIGNAVKYTRQGGVLLACRVRGVGSARSLRLEVWDSGPGIGPEHRERIFDEFFRISPGRSSTEGLGLGLPIVRRLAQLLDLRLQLRSRPDHGSCFTVSIDLSTVAVQQPDEPIAAPDPSLQGYRIGVLEDDETVRDAMVRVLRRWGCDVVAGESAAAMAAATGAQRPLDLLVVDYALQDGASGPDEARAFAEITSTQPKMVFITGEQSSERLRELAALQVPWLPKPVATAALRRAIAGLLATSATPSGD